MALYHVHMSWVGKGQHAGGARGFHQYLSRDGVGDGVQFHRYLEREVAYLSPADNVARPHPYRLRRLHQPVINPPHWFSTPRSPLLSSIGAHASHSIARSSTSILF